MIRRPERLVLLGHALAHSLSPRIQNAALRSAGVPIEYEALDLEPDEIPDALERLRATNAAGNVTAKTTVTVDNVPPVVSGGLPNTVLAAGTTVATLSVVTNENATCAYSTNASAAFSAMTTFTTTGGTSHKAHSAVAKHAKPTRKAHTPKPKHHKKA